MTLTDYIRKPQVQALLWRACGASGFIGSGVAKVCHHFGLPVPDPDTLTILISGALTEAVEWVIAWYRNNPNNLIRRVARIINGNGPKITDSSKTQLAVALTTIPGVQITVDTANGSRAPSQLKDLANQPQVGDVVPKEVVP